MMLVIKFMIGISVKLLSLPPPLHKSGFGGDWGAKRRVWGKQDMEWAVHLHTYQFKIQQEKWIFSSFSAIYLYICNAKFF